jgi:lipopolysaccharide transport system permease protein
MGDKVTGLWRITSRTSWAGTGWGELFAYRDLMYRMVRKDILLYYQQTLLGPFWMVLQPILTVIAYVFIFDKIIGLPTDGVPSFLFYLCGITLWTLFSDIFTGVSGTFTQNVQIFTKVYFPRIIAPLATTLLHLLRFVIQLLLLVVVILYYRFSGQFTNSGNWLLVIPVILITAGLGFGGGLIFSVLTVAYRDLINFQQLIVRLLMFVCPIFFSFSMIDPGKRIFVNLNPLSPLFEAFRLAFLGKGHISLASIMFSFVFMLVTVIGGMLLFNRKSDRLVDLI